MDKPYTDFYTAWRWLSSHPKMKGRYGNSHFDDYLIIGVARVNPATESIDDDRTKNTATRIWLECCITDLDEYVPEVSNSERILDHDLDCGAMTFELAIQELADLVLKRYGGYTPRD